jgi:LCP family protein required for cell wall assembly
MPGRIRRVAVVAAVVLGVLLTAGGLAAGLVAEQLKGNITAADITPRLGDDRPDSRSLSRAAAGSAEVAQGSAGRAPLNILVIGSDSRQGDNRTVGIGGKADEGRADTTMLLHLSADRASAVAVSIPRDSMVAMPSCTDRGGRPYPAGLRQFNDAYTIGGAACTVRTVEQVTRIRIDHYVEFDFAGFTGVVDALGSVEICLPQAVDDRRHHIRLPAGRSRVGGRQALAYVRERYALGDGGDLSRIGRQQAFLSSVLQEATSADTLGNPVRLYAFLDAATKSVTMDPGLASLPRLVDLVGEVRAIGLANIRFLTVPTGAYPADRNRLAWTPAATDLWRAIRADRPIVLDDGAAAGDRGAAVPDTAADPDTAAVDGETVARQGVRLRVVNDSGRQGPGRRAAEQLRSAGFTVVGVRAGSHRAGIPHTQVRYGTGQLARARLLSAALPFARLTPDPTLGHMIVVVAGRDWTAPQTTAAGRGAPGSAASSTPGSAVRVSAQGRAADADICDGGSRG